LDRVFKIAPISADHVAKFRGDRPRDRGDLAAYKKKERKKERKKETAAKHNGSRVALSQPAALIKYVKCVFYIYRLHALHVVQRNH